MADQSSPKFRATSVIRCTSKREPASVVKTIPGKTEMGRLVQPLSPAATHQNQPVSRGRGQILWTVQRVG